MSTKELSHSEQQAVAQLESIREMVAALECDYDRLEELRDERDEYNVPLDDDTNDERAKEWSEANPEDAAELAELEKAAGDCADQDHARTRIDEDPLSVLVRGDWYTPGTLKAEDCQPVEYEILLCTGGPACRIRGELDDNCEPDTARLQHQDWGTPWTDWPLTSEDEEAILTYARCFYYSA